MRLGFLVGQAGVRALLLLCSAFAIAFLTTLSLCVVSNGQVPGGGLYGSLRKSIGPELAAVISVMFFAAYTAGIANYTVVRPRLVDQAGISSKSAINVFPWNRRRLDRDVVASIATLAAAVICSWGSSLEHVPC